MARLVEFEPRFFPDILQDAVNFLRILAPDLTDYEIGSRIRSLLEVQAMEQDEAYHQMATILDLLNIDNVNGVDLDDFLAGRNLSRLDGFPALGQVIVSNNNLTTSFLSAGIAATATSLTLYSTAAFPTSGFPYNVRIGEGTTAAETVAVSANSTATNTLTVATTASAHSKDARVSLIEGGSLVAPSGTKVKVKVPASSFITPSATLLEDATIAAGNFNSDPVLVKSDLNGPQGRYARGTVDGWLGTPPFDGAVVRNDAAFGGGRDDESDNSFRERGRKHPQNLARSIPSALKELPIGFTFVDTNGVTWRIVSVGIREVFRNNCSDLVYLYIWPGAFNFVEQTAITTPEVLTASAEEGRTWFRLENYPLVPSTDVVQHQPVGTAVWNNLVRGTDYFVNEATGWLEYVGGLSKGDGLRVFSYSYYTGLLQRAQEFIDGAISNRTELEGVRSAGIKVLVTFPRRVTINNIRCAIQVLDGREADVAPLVEDEISKYISGLGVGEDFILAEAIERAMSVPNMYNIQFSSPTGDIFVPEDSIIDTTNLVISAS